MAHSHRPKPPLDVLQSMINGILIEIGRALRTTDKEGGRTLANSNTRLRSFFPGAIDNFHQALDDLEGDIFRAKAVFLRDQADLQARRHALENPPATPVLETTTDDSIPAENMQGDLSTANTETSPPATVKEEQTEPQETAPEVSDAEDVKPVTADPPNDMVPEVSESSKDLQGSSPPDPTKDSNKPTPVGLGIDTTASTEDPALATSGMPDSSIDSLFDIVDIGDNVLDMNFDSTDFLDASNTQDQNDFDLSTFGNTEDFNLDLQTSNDADNTNTSKEQDDLFGLGDSGGAGDLMDLDLDLTAGGEVSAFDDMFNFGGDEDGGREMEHGDADSAFFGIE